MILEDSCCSGSSSGGSRGLGDFSEERAGVFSESSLLIGSCGLGYSPAGSSFSVLAVGDYVLPNGVV